MEVVVVEGADDVDDVLGEAQGMKGVKQVGAKQGGEGVGKI